MLTDRPAVRRLRRHMRSRNNRAMFIAVPAGIALAVVLTAGIVVAVSRQNPVATAKRAADSSNNAVVSTSAVNTNCDLIVPAHPLTARGLATPYQLTGPAGTTPAASGCQTVNNLLLGAFVQATILDPRTGKLFVYDPLVITQGTTSAIAPVVPKLPAHAIVTIDFGFNGNILFLVGATPSALAEGNCTNGMPGSPFGQVSFCNGAKFFSVASRMQGTSRMAMPAAGRSARLVASGGSLGTGNQCPTVRNFEMVDQDPSDNVTTQYLLDPATGQTAQDTAANAARMPGARVLNNGSDNALIDDFIDPALGCTPLRAPDLANHGAMSTSQALDELLAAANQPTVAALVPENDAMVTGLGGGLNPAKTDLYRSEVGQPMIGTRDSANSSPDMYCQNLVNIQTPFLAANEQVFEASPSPVPTVGDTLFTFLAARESASFTNLGCKNFGLTNPVAVVNNGAGAATEATLNTAQQSASF
jgi:hypothetical protein